MIKMISNDDHQLGGGWIGWIEGNIIEESRRELSRRVAAIT